MKTETILTENYLQSRFLINIHKLSYNYEASGINTIFPCVLDSSLEISIKVEGI